MLLSLRHVLLLIPLLCLSFAIPTENFLPDNDIHSSTSNCLFQSQPRTGLLKSLRNYVIERIWTVPDKSRSKNKNTKDFTTAPTTFRTRYGNDVILRFSYATPEDGRAILSASEILYLDVWDVSANWIDLRVAKDIVPSFLSLLPRQLHNSYQPLMHDLAQAVYDTYPGAGHRFKPLSQSPRDTFFQEYQPLSVIYPWLQLMASLFPDHVTLTTIGKSAEGRDIPALRIGAKDKKATVPDQGEAQRKTVLITAGGHAREWISVSTATYLANNLATRYGAPRNAAVTKFLDHFDVVVIPVMNPDGYDYTWSTDRLWRKNRQQTTVPFCPGIDLDRAFQFHWDGNNSADNPCSEDYAGTASLQAIESAGLTRWAKNETENNNVKFEAFLDLHSYAQEILYPYSYSCDAVPRNIETLEEVALGLSKALRLSHNHYYSINSACEGGVTIAQSDKKPRVQLKAAGGSALDYFYHDLGVKYAFQIKLRDTGTYGFLLPKSNIVPTGSEAFAAMLGLGKWLLGNHGIESYPDPSSIWSMDESILDLATTTADERTSIDKPQKIEEKVLTQELDDEGQYEYQLDLRRRRRKR